MSTTATLRRHSHETASAAEMLASHPVHCKVTVPNRRRPEEPAFVRSTHPRPGGTPANSPAFQRRGRTTLGLGVPEGRPPLTHYDPFQNSDVIANRRRRRETALSKAEEEPALTGCATNAQTSTTQNPCHPERNLVLAKRTPNAVEGPLPSFRSFFSRLDPFSFSRPIAL